MGVQVSGRSPVRAGVAGLSEFGKGGEQLGGEGVRMEKTPKS